MVTGLPAIRRTRRRPARSWAAEDTVQDAAERPIAVEDMTAHQDLYYLLGCHADTSFPGSPRCCSGSGHRSSWVKICRKNRNTFRMSRKIDAASNGAEATSVLVRARWKSNRMNPAKITRPSTE